MYYYNKLFKNKKYENNELLENKSIKLIIY